MRIFVTGAAGQLGSDVITELLGRGYECIGSDMVVPQGGALPEKVEYVKLDITDADAVGQALAAARPDAVIHCAAWTAVDAAEDAENRERVRLVNAVGADNIARECALLGCKLLYISTDYVFDGSGEQPWLPDCRDYAPQCWYGQTKLMGEQAVEKALDRYFIVRTAWVFGLNGRNFVRTIINAGKKYGTVRVVNDQIGTPTYTPDLARLLADMIATEKYGYYHATNEGGYISWYDFTREIFRTAGINAEVIPVTTEEYGLSKAVRPHNSRLDRSKLAENGFEPLPHWQDALRRYIKLLDGNY